MTQEREYYNNLREIRNGKIRPSDPLNSYYDYDREDYDEFKKGGGLFAGCALALFATAVIASSIWYVIKQLM